MDTDRAFIKSFVDEAMECLTDYHNCELNIEVHNPPLMKTPTINGVYYSPGHLVLSFHKKASEEFTDIDFFFLYYENGKFLRRGLSEKDKEQLRTSNSGNAEVFAYNFDECWQIVCLLGERLEVSKISISCGAA
ncbi:MAG TPA: hypothetical protein VK308_16925 [Pyrinomonadaceae bacterium]|nr:hypothetical protein [Pyrinomonadaceae bacterium]